ncbi:energy-coupling factor transporter transmembrane component T family protein [Auritidibacter ignavus]|uniref:energy-coupling factor transporter transmembrane component T family protein n=1 Tax=Auritidibacter ignavus TaxID=678932 RepID=UPI000D73B08D|nr:cobalt ABC transporter permease [Auritidibacter sp. NML120779]
MARKQRDVLSIEWVKLELIRTAYATRGGLFSKMDPRAVIVWYLILAIVPWFTHNVTVLAGLFLLGAVSVIAARVGPLVLGLFIIGLGFEIIYLVAASLLFGGNFDTLIALGVLNLKLGAVSMASMAAFVSLDPEKLSDALLAFKAPSLLAFGVSYGYRMLPIMVEEFNTVFDGYRLRMATPEKHGILGWRTIVHWVKMAVLSFYPIFLNTAKNARTTVEALETRGFTYAQEDGRGRQLRLAYLTITTLDIAVLAGTIILIVLCFWAGAMWPIYRT